jgi:hypothetical protein
MTKQSDALRLADFLDDLDVRTPYCIMNCVSAAAELRRLDEVNADLLGALQIAQSIIGRPDDPHSQHIARVIAKATGEIK